MLCGVISCLSQGMDRSVTANRTNTVQYVAVLSCLSCLAAAVCHPCSKGQQTATCVYVLADPTYQPLQPFQVSSEQ